MPGPMAAATGPATADGGDAGLEHAARQPAPAGVDHAGGAGAGQRDRQAVGHEHDGRDARRAS